MTTVVATVDLRSDTVTKPTRAMREAMMAAEVGDDVFGEDPNVKALESLSAEYLGKEAGLFVASGTMGNLVSLLTHCQRGDEILVSRGAHIFQYEQGGAASLGGLLLNPLGSSKMEHLKAEDVAENISADDVHKPRTRLVCLENTLNGRVIAKETVDQICTVAKEKGLKTHLDGARLFNASRTLDLTPSSLVENIDTVQFCFSKGLAAPVGSMIVGPLSFIEEARRARKLVGGGMRQVGVLAAACKIALTEMVERLDEDHRNARKLAEAINEMEYLRVNLDHCDTNMVWIETQFEENSAEDLVELLKKEGILMLAISNSKIRAVTHHGITDSDIDRCVDIIAKAAGKLGKKVKAKI